MGSMRRRASARNAAAEMRHAEKVVRPPVARLDLDRSDRESEVPGLTKYRSPAGVAFHCLSPVNRTTVTTTTRARCGYRSFSRWRASIRGAIVRSTFALDVSRSKAKS